MSSIELVAQTPSTDYYVVRSAAKMPQNCWGKYEHVAVVSQSSGAPAPKLIANTKRGRVRGTWSNKFSGSSKRCAAERAASAAISYALRLAAAERREFNALAADYHRGEGC
jgi:hypothetical protein